VRQQWTARVSGSVADTGELVTAKGGSQGLAVPVDPRWLTMVDAAGKQLWRRLIKGGSPQSPGVGDLDGDGSTEIVISDQAGVGVLLRRLRQAEMAILTAGTGAGSGHRQLLRPAAGG